MKIREIRNELEKIYKERKSWDGAKGPFTQSAIRQRELILIKQQILYRIEDVKLLKDEDEKSFNLKLHKIINDYLKTISEMGYKRNSKLKEKIYGKTLLH